MRDILNSRSFGKLPTVIRSSSAVGRIKHGLRNMMNHIKVYITLAHVRKQLPLPFLAYEARFEQINGNSWAPQLRVFPGPHSELWILFPSILFYFLVTGSHTETLDLNSCACLGQGHFVPCQQVASSLRQCDWPGRCRLLSFLPHQLSHLPWRGPYDLMEYAALRSWPLLCPRSTSDPLHGSYWNIYARLCVWTGILIETHLRIFNGVSSNGQGLFMLYWSIYFLYCL